MLKLLWIELFISCLVYCFVLLLIALRVMESFQVERNIFMLKDATKKKLKKYLSMIVEMLKNIANIEDTIKEARAQQFIKKRYEVTFQVEFLFDLLVSR